MLRTFFLPIVLISLVGIPMLYSHHQASMQQQSPFLDGSSSPNGQYNNQSWGAGNGNGFYSPASQTQFGNGSSTSFNGVSYGPPPTQQSQYGNSQFFQSNINPNINSIGNTASNGNVSGFENANARSQQPPRQPFGNTYNPVNPNGSRNNVVGPQSTNTVSSPQVIGRQAGYAPNPIIMASPQPDASGFIPVVRPGTTMTSPAPSGAGSFGGPVGSSVPDFGRAETLVFPGDANGPDLSAKPMSFVPVTDFNEIFRFNINPDWVKNRWDRVSTCPGAQGLHGLRISLVTGTNTWDLHGSLTYFFDFNQRVQRITFRGWTGDATRLLQLLSSQYQFQPQQTHWAGFFLANRKGNTAKSGMLMQHPTVIRKDNPVQKLAIILQLNNPQSPIMLSDEFVSLTPAAQPN